jgi:hypothetical protein
MSKIVMAKIASFSAAPIYIPLLNKKIGLVLQLNSFLLLKKNLTKAILATHYTK